MSKKSTSWHEVSSVEGEINVIFHLPSKGTVCFPGDIQSCIPLVDPTITTEFLGTSSVILYSARSHQERGEQGPQLAWSLVLLVFEMHLAALQIPSSQAMLHHSIFSHRESPQKEREVGRNGVEGPQLRLGGSRAHRMLCAKE
jgi:hypothetical protein